jgi:hypothetical protein
MAVTREIALRIKANADRLEEEMREIELLFGKTRRKLKGEHQSEAPGEWAPVLDDKPAGTMVGVFTDGPKEMEREIALKQKMEEIRRGVQKEIAFMMGYRPKEASEEIPPKGKMLVEIYACKDEIARIWCNVEKIEERLGEMEQRLNHLEGKSWSGGSVWEGEVLEAQPKEKRDEC